MNANELADKLEGYGVIYVKFEYRKQAAAMLRQQQAEIEKLGSELNRIVELYTDKAIENEALEKELALQKLSDIGQIIESPVGPNWWKGDPTCGGIAENYMSKKVSENE